MYPTGQQNTAIGHIENPAKGSILAEILSFSLIKVRKQSMLTQGADPLFSPAHLQVHCPFISNTSSQWVGFDRT